MYTWQRENWNIYQTYLTFSVPYFTLNACILMCSLQCKILSSGWLISNFIYFIMYYTVNGKIMGLGMKGIGVCIPTTVGQLESWGLKLIELCYVTNKVRNAGVGLTLNSSMGWCISLCESANILFWLHGIFVFWLLFFNGTLFKHGKLTLICLLGKYISGC